MSEYPEVIGELAARLARRSTAGGLRLSLVQQPRLPTRVHLMLWHLADRFGRVHPDGVTLPVPLCHGLLSWLVGASRPAVCRAANELERAGLVAHRPDGTWWLDHQPPEGLALTTGAQPVAS
jgi:CRP-like cAMP-binding protein